MLVDTFGTITVIVTFLLPDFTVILVVPVFIPFITPFDDTVATFLFEELYVILSWEVTGESTGLNVSVLPLVTVYFVLRP